MDVLGRNRTSTDVLYILLFHSRESTFPGEVRKMEIGSSHPGKDWWRSICHSGTKRYCRNLTWNQFEDRLESIVIEKSTTSSDIRSCSRCFPAMVRHQRNL